MTIATKSLQDASANWTSVTPGRADVYERNSLAAVARLVANTIAGIPNFQSAVAGAAVANRIRTNVTGKGARRYPAKITAVGRARFGEGVRAAGPEFEAGFGPMLRVIQGVDLPAKGPRGADTNYNRVRAVGDALHRARLLATATS